MIDRKKKESINASLISSLTEKYDRSLNIRMGESERIFNRIREDKTLSKRQKEVQLRAALITLIGEQIKEAEDYFYPVMGAQYNLDRDFIGAYRQNKESGSMSKDDNRRFTGKQRRAASDRNKDYYVHYVYADINKGRMIGKYEGKSNHGIMGDAIRESTLKINRLETGTQKAQAFRDAIARASDDSMSSSVSFWRKTMDEAAGETSRGTPFLQHIASSEACTFCKMFDIYNYSVSSASKRPHVGCRCSRIPLVYDDLLFDEQPWRADFEEMEGRLWEEVSEDNQVVSYETMLSRIRKAERQRAAGKTVDYKAISESK